MDMNRDNNRRLSLNSSGSRPGSKHGAKPGGKPAPKSGGRKLDGHEHELLGIKREAGTARVTVKTMSGSVMTGDLVDFDRFSVTVVIPEIGRQVIFKHAIESFYKVA